MTTPIPEGSIAEIQPRGSVLFSEKRFGWEALVVCIANPEVDQRRKKFLAELKHLRK